MLELYGKSRLRSVENMIQTRNHARSCDLLRKSKLCTNPPFVSPEVSPEGLGWNIPERFVLKGSVPRIVQSS
jgi:hypothetical protein